MPAVSSDRPVENALSKLRHIYRRIMIFIPPIPPRLLGPRHDAFRYLLDNGVVEFTSVQIARINFDGRHCILMYAEKPKTTAAWRHGKPSKQRFARSPYCCDEVHDFHLHPPGRRFTAHATRRNRSCFSFNACSCSNVTSRPARLLPRRHSSSSSRSAISILVMTLSVGGKSPRR